MKPDIKIVQNDPEPLTETPTTETPTTEAPTTETPTTETPTEVEATGRSETVEEIQAPGPETPPDPTPGPEPDADGRHDLARAEYYLNRELTWLNFNFRVLNEAEDARVPLLERMKFIAIVSSNIDEFFMKRIGGLKQQHGAGIHGAERQTV